MKRNVDLIRNILLWAEEQEGSHVSVWETRHPNYHNDYHNVLKSKFNEIVHHVNLMDQYGLIKITDEEDKRYFSLTNFGYDFIALTRDEEKWLEAKNILLKINNEIVFELLYEYLNTNAREMLYT